MPDWLAERAGFEPAVRYKRTLAFQASALSRSATSPNFSCLSCLKEQTAGFLYTSSPPAGAAFLPWVSAFP